MLDFCPDCNGSVYEDTRTLPFTVGGKRNITLFATAAVGVCASPACGIICFDWRMEQAQAIRVNAWSRAQVIGIPEPYLTAHAFCSNHSKQLERDGGGGCFYCCSLFKLNDVTLEWTDDGNTALCPWCGTDTVLPLKFAAYATTPPYSELSVGFLRAMNSYWFAPVKAL